MDRLFACLRDEEGATAIEYGLIAGLIAVVIIGVVTTVGGDLTNVFTRIGNELDVAATSE